MAEETQGNILVVDDDDLFREGVLDLLQEEGYVVHEAKNGQEGLEMVQTIKPDLAIVDLSMPKMHGLELIEKIRKVNPSIQLIVCSSKSGLKDDIAIRCFNVGGFFVKPVDSTALVTKVRKLLFHL